MGEACERCSFQAVYDVELRSVREDLVELRGRLERIEVWLMRGVLLLVANLTGMVMMLAQEVL